MVFDARHLLPVALLGALLAMAVASDMRERRIPNALVLAGMVAGLALQGLLVPGAGLFDVPFGALGLLPAAGGLALGLLLLLPMYALNAMGAGDVKLMAMVGTFLGPRDTAGAVLATLLAGGAMAILAALYSGTLRKVLSNVKTMMLGSALSALAGAGARMEEPVVPTGKLPYAVAIAAGTTLYLTASRWLGWHLPWIS